MLVRPARCDELGCNVHRPMFNNLVGALRWSSTLHGGAAHPLLQRVARRCNTSCRFLCSLATALRSQRLAGIALLLMLPAHVAPTILGGTARELSCTCAVRLVRVCVTARTGRPLSVCLCYATALTCACAFSLPFRRQVLSAHERVRVGAC